MPTIASAPLSQTFRLDHLAAGAWLAGEELAWLEGAGGPPDLIQTGILAIGPARTIIEGTGSDPFPALERELQKIRSLERFDFDDAGGDPVAHGPFQGGCIGYISYECARFFENVAVSQERVLETPDLRFYFPTVWVQRHGATTRVYCIFDGDARAAARAIDEARTHVLRLELLGAERKAQPPIETKVVNPWSRDRYVLSAAWIKEQIAAGEIYQGNLSQPFIAIGTADPFDIHLQLIKNNPSPFAAFLGFGHTAIVSASPELFLRKRGRSIETRPIKGTRRRTGDPARDAVAIEELLSSKKDRAELAMIVDLERNDLSRVCEPGSVTVAREREIETFASVYHGVATVTGRLQAAATVRAILQATFPGGSITGCPRIRAMDLLHQIEHEPRGPNFGAIGWIGYDQSGAAGDLDLNIAIRTLTFLRDARAPGRGGWICSFRTGGGIVAESDPVEEYKESLVKARALARAIGDSGFDQRNSI